MRGNAALPPGSLSPVQATARPQRRLPVQPWTLFHLCVGGMILTYTWRVQELFLPLAAIRASLLISAIAILMSLLRDDLPRMIALRQHPTVKYAGWVLLWMTLSIPTSVYVGASFKHVLFEHSKTIIFMLLIAAAVRSMRDVERFALVQVFGAVIFSVMSLVRGPGADGRLGGSATYDANDLAMVMVLTIPMAIFLAIKKKGLLRLLGIAGTLVFTLTVVKSASRGGFLALIAAFVFMLFQLRIVSKGVRFGLAAAAILAFFFAAPAEYRATMSTILKPKEDYNWAGNNASGRMEIWKRGIGYMMRRPITGVGSGAFHVAEGTMSQLSKDRAAIGAGLKWSTAHNAYVQVGAELGFPGLLFFIAMVFTAFRACHSIGRRAPPGSNAAAMGQLLAASMVGYGAAAMFLSSGYATYLYGLLGLIIGFTFWCVPAVVPTVATTGRAGRRVSVAPARRGGVPVRVIR